MQSLLRMGEKVRFSRNNLIKKFGINLSQNVKLCNYSWFNLGGNAEFFFKPKEAVKLEYDLLNLFAVISL